MKKLLLASLLLVAAAANAATPLDLSVGGSRLGKGHRNFFLKILGFEPAARLYLEPVAGEEGSYYGVLLDYARLGGIAPKYLGAHVLKGAPNKVFGYLNHIAKRIAVYKITPTDATGSAYTLRPVKVVGEQIVANEKATPMTLRLDPQLRIDDPLGGANIYQADEKGKEQLKYVFPKDEGLLHGAEYDAARLAYNVAHLSSTWHHEYMVGPYLAAYHKEDDVVLNLAGQGDELSASFVSDPKFDSDESKKRAKVFTNAKSAAIRGEFKATQSVEGMYVLTPKGEATAAGKDAAGRIGLFLDIFDAREALGQAVVELAFINPEDPKDFLMYYTGGSK